MPVRNVPPAVVVRRESHRCLATATTTRSKTLQGGVLSGHRLPEGQLRGAPRPSLPGARGLRELVYKWQDRPPTPRQVRRAELDKAVAGVFDASEGRYGSPRVHDELVKAGWKVSEKTVAASMARQRLVARPKRRFRCLTRQDAPPRPSRTW